MHMRVTSKSLPLSCSITSTFPLLYIPSITNCSLLLQAPIPVTFCICPLPRTMSLYVTILNCFFPFSFQLPPVESLDLCCSVLLPTILQAVSTLFGPVHNLMKPISLRLAGPRRRPDYLPSSPAKTKRFLHLQAQFSMTLRAGKRFPRPSRRRVIGYLPIRLRPGRRCSSAA